jgi:hypothetical protein
MIECFLLTPVDNSDFLWATPEGEVYQLGNTEARGIQPAPVGAMWDAHWLTGLDVGGARPFGGPDGLTLIVRTPGGDWVIDGPSFKDGKPWGPGWRRTGEPPHLTVNPSINMPGFHGWLKNGILLPA